MSKKYFIFSDSDLDGVCSYLTLCWFLTGEPNIPYVLTTVTKFKQDFDIWKQTNNFSDYDRIFFLDMDLTNDIKLIDKKNVVVIDHHRTHVPNIPQYTKAKTIIREDTSATKLIYKSFYKTKELSKKQKVLIGLADDYDSYQLKVPESYDLHVVYYQTQNSVDKTRAQKFIDNFSSGFVGFTEQQKNLVAIHRSEIRKLIAGLEIHGGKMIIDGQKIEMRATVCGKAINEVADYLIKVKGAEVAIVVNPNSSRVSFRRNAASTNVDVSKIAAKLVDGGGHEYAAGGQVTDAFLEFTKLLKPINA